MNDQHERILILEGNPDLGRMLAAILQSEQYTADWR